MVPKRNCLNCEHLGEDWTCRAGGRREIGNPFEERTDCSDWKLAEEGSGIPQPFPPCTPEYDVTVQETIEKALADYSKQKVMGAEEGDSAQKEENPRQKASQKS